MVGSRFVVCFQNQLAADLPEGPISPPPPRTSVAVWFVLYSVSVRSFYTLWNVSMAIIFTDVLDGSWLRTLVEKNLIQSMKVMSSESPDIKKKLHEYLWKS